MSNHDIRRDRRMIVTRRDLFAAHAMQAIVVACDADVMVVGRRGAVGLAVDAYIVADAMEKARQMDLSSDDDG